MVRVISVHHFSNQDIHTCEEPLAATTAPPDRLLLAFAQHVIEVRDLAKGGDPMFTFPTVDEVHSMIYCCNGDYVATLEHKQNRQGGQCSYSRVYSNWADSNAVQQPMRARIAGHVTPSSAQTGSGGLEMIELPLKRTPNAIACCQVTGNIIIASNRTLYFYYFKVKTHDISRQKFIDFEESPISLDLCFSPLKLEICEDVIACMSKEYLHIFKIGQLEKEKMEQNLRTKKGSINSHNETKKERSSINWDEILREEYDGNTSLKEKDNSENWLEKLDKNSFPVTVHLPGIESQETVPRPEGPSYRNTPFKVAPLEMTINVHCSSPSASFMEDTSITNLLQLQLLSSLNGSCSQGICVGREEFRCLTLKPMYLKKGKCSSSSKYEVKNSNPMRSCYWKNLGSVVCVVSTQQEGFVYHFPMSGSVETLKLQQAACVTVYPFTAPVLCIVMENYLLHALTEVGLETYTLRSGHQLLQGIQDVDNINFTCPTSDDPVCLVGLRPFLGVEHMLLSDLHLSLLACSEGSSMSSQDSHSMNWTLYSLQIPQPSTLYSDILTIASVHRWSSPTTYCHLLCEAHVILQIALNTVSWISKLNHAVGLAEPMINKEDTEKLELLFKDSCALLGDYYINCDCEEDWELATPYYNMSGLSPADVIVRVQNLEIPKEVDNDIRKQNQLKGLMKYLKTSLFLVGQGTQNFNPSIPNVTNTLLDLFETYNPCEVSLLVLHSNLLREYATDRVLNVMKKQLCSRAAPNPSDALALVLLYVQKGSPEQANAVLNSFDSNQLSNILTEKRNILFEVSSTAKSNNRSGDGRYNRTSDSPLTFSELSVILMDSNPNVLASVLSNLVARHIMSLQEVLQVFLEYLPSRIGITGSSASLVLQVFLENYFVNYFSVHRENGFSSVNSLPVIEALKILVRSYLSDLQYYNISNKKSGNEKHPPEIGRLITKKNPLFAETRFSFLQKMPPFAPNLSKRLLAHQNGETIDDSKSDDSDEINEQKNKSLIKLQCLLCSGKLPKECVLEVYQFLQTHPQLHGNLSLQILCVPTKEATSVLLNFCPQSLLQFAKDKYIGDNEYRHLLTLLHKKIQAISNDLLKPYYLQVMNDILTHAAQTFPLDTLRQILPPESEADYSNFIHMGQQVTHANHIRTLIMVTGHQLLVTLKL